MFSHVFVGSYKNKFGNAHESERDDFQNCFGRHSLKSETEKDEFLFYFLIYIL